MMKVTFQNDKPSEFYLALGKRVSEYFKTQQHNRKATPLYWFKITSLLVMFFTLYALVFLFPQYYTVVMGAYLGMGVLIVSILFAIGHDSVHNSVSSNPKVNYVMGYIWNFFGISSYFWRLKHNVSHHAFTNIPGSDGDLDQTKLLRLNPLSPRTPIHRYQHLYAMAIYSLLGPYIIFIRDFKLLKEKKFGNTVIEKHPTSEIFIIILSKIWFLLMMVVFPVYFTGLSVGSVLIATLAMMFVAGIFTAIVSFPVHVTYESDYALPNDQGIVEMDFMTHQILTTVDYSAENKFIHWFFGGINTHVVHHMFPGVNHIHYYDLTKIVRDTAAEYNIRYVNKTFATVMRDHLLFLRELGTRDNPTNLTFI
ncbi:MAG: acyl-CoA desaturase [Saprospiraceae bacterium]